MIGFSLPALKSITAGSQFIYRQAFGALDQRSSRSVRPCLPKPAQSRALPRAGAARRRRPAPAGGRPPIPCGGAAGGSVAEPLSDAGGGRAVRASTACRVGESEGIWRPGIDLMSPAGMGGGISGAACSSLRAALATPKSAPRSVSIWCLIPRWPLCRSRRSAWRAKSGGARSAISGGGMQDVHEPGGCGLGRSMAASLGWPSAARGSRR